MRSAVALAAALACLLVDTPARAGTDDWFGPDKELHFGATAGLAVLGYGATSYFSDDRRLRLAVGAGLGIAVGAAKELWDLAGHGDPSWKDFAWDVVGTAAGLLLSWGLDVLLCGSAPDATASASARAVIVSPLAVRVLF
jgi:putative lipoprotein